MSGYLIARLKAMDDDLLALFCEADMATQKLIHLICVLSTDRLFFEFVYEVYREKVQIGAAYLEDSDINAFFTAKRSAERSDSKLERLHKKAFAGKLFEFYA